MTAADMPATSNTQYTQQTTYPVEQTVSTLPNGKKIDGLYAYVVLAVGGLWSFIETCLSIKALADISRLESLINQISSGDISSFGSTTSSDGSSGSTFPSGSDGTVNFSFADPQSLIARLRGVAAAGLVIFLLMTVINLVSIAAIRRMRPSLIFKANVAHAGILVLSVGLFIYIAIALGFPVRLFIFLLFQCIILGVCWMFPKKINQLLDEPAIAMGNVQ
ncbi:hypothetical protein RI367_005097 [Sorochytrium milnesiophthora]